MFAILAYIGFLGLFFGLSVALLFGLRTAKII